jgi:hypothetical protein
MQYMQVSSTGGALYAQVHATTTSTASVQAGVAGRGCTKADTGTTGVLSGCSCGDGMTASASTMLSSKDKGGLTLDAIVAISVETEARPVLERVTCQKQG